jgi:hypothetical protein
MPRRQRAAVFGAPAGLLAIDACLLMACVSATDPTSLPLLQTDGDTYPFVGTASGLSVSIPYTFTNRTGGSVYLGNCRGSFALHLERAVGDVWQTAWSPILAACLSPPIVIAADEVWTGTLHVEGGTPDGNTWPRFDVTDPAGTYRLVWDAAVGWYKDDPSSGVSLPLRERISNTFELTNE